MMKEGGQEAKHLPNNDSSLQAGRTTAASHEDRQLITASAQDEYDLEDDVSGEEDEDYNEEEAFMHTEALIAHAQDLIAKVGDPKVALDLMDLDADEKRLLMHRLQERAYLQQQRQMLNQLSDEELLRLSAGATEGKHYNQGGAVHAGQDLAGDFMNAPSCMGPIPKSLDLATAEQMALARSEPVMPQQERPTYKMSWIEWFCSLEGHDLLQCVDPEWLSDKFNLMKLEEGSGFNQKRVKQCLELMLQTSSPTPEQLKDENFLRLNQDTSDIYGIVHARYCRSENGKFSPD